MTPIFGRRDRIDTGPGADPVLVLIAADAARVLPGAEMDEHSGDLLVPVPGGRARVATAALIDHARSEPESARAEIVRRWLVDIAAQLNATDTTADDAAASSSPPAVALRLQVSPAWAPDALATVASSPVGTCFDAIVLRLDTPRPSFLLREDADAFGGQVEAAAIAARETIQQDLLDVDVRDHDADGSRMRMIAEDDSPFVTTVLLSLQRFLPVDTDDALVIAPRYSAVGLVPVMSKADIPIAAPFAAIAASLHRDATDPCSPAVYWWHDGEFFALDIDADNTVDLPLELADVIAALP